MRCICWTTYAALLIAGISACNHPDQRPADQTDSAKAVAPAPANPPAGAGSATAAAAAAAADSGAHSGMQLASAGVYTKAQALQGADIYAGMCKSCHAGLGNHTGPVFRAHWGGKPLAALFDYMNTNMPKNDPGSISADDNVLVLAYLLQLNNIPAGKTELPADYDALAKILLDTSAAAGARLP